MCQVFLEENSLVFLKHKSIANLAVASDWMVDTLGQYELTNVSKTLNYDASKTLGI